MATMVTLVLDKEREESGWIMWDVMAMKGTYACVDIEVGTLMIAIMEKMPVFIVIEVCVSV